MQNWWNAQPTVDGGGGRVLGEQVGAFWLVGGHREHFLLVPLVCLPF